MSFKDKIFKNLYNELGWEIDTGSTREPPSLDEIIANIQKKINQFFPGGKSGGSGPRVAKILVFLWFISAYIECFQMNKELY